MPGVLRFTSVIFAKFLSTNCSRRRSIVSWLSLHYLAAFGILVRV